MLSIAYVHTDTIRPGTRVYNLMYAKADSHKIHQFMYYADSLLSLSRKRVKLAAFVGQAQDAIMLR